MGLQSNKIVWNGISELGESQLILYVMSLNLILYLIIALP